MNGTSCLIWHVRVFIGMNSAEPHPLSNAVARTRRNVLVVI